MVYTCTLAANAVNVHVHVDFDIHVTDIVVMQVLPL